MSLAADPVLRQLPLRDGYTVLGPCLLWESLGAGGMGSVYLGRHMQLNVDVAVKCLDPIRAHRDQEYVKRFRREAQVAASISHENLVRVFGLESEADLDLYYIVLEYVRGENLRQRVHRKGPLSVDESTKILLGCARGLAAAHKRGYVHRDIKPDNLMVSSDGTVKVTDLGLARAMDEDSTITQGNAPGTPSYMAPEQWEGQDATAPSDVYALGMSYYFMLAGRDAFRGSLNQLFVQVREQEYPPLSEVVTDLPPALLQIFEKCVALDGSDRFSNCTELVAAIEAAFGPSVAGLEDDKAAPQTTGSTQLTPPSREIVESVRLAVEKGELKSETATLATIPHVAPAASEPLPSKSNSAPKPSRGWLYALLGVAALIALGVILREPASDLLDKWNAARVEDPAKEPGRFAQSLSDDAISIDEPAGGVIVSNDWLCTGRIVDPRVTGITVDGVEAQLDGNLFSAKLNLPEDSTSPWPITIRSTAADLNPVEHHRQWVVDREAPALTVASPQPGVEVCIVETVRFTGNVSDSVSTADQIVINARVEGSRDRSERVLATVRADGSWFADLRAPEGNQRVILTATDHRGHASNPVTVPLEVSFFPELSQRISELGETDEGYTKYVVDIKMYNTFIRIPPTSFEMGSESMVAADDEKPVHVVELGEYYISMFEVTNGQYKEYCDDPATAATYPPDPGFPGMPDYFTNPEFETYPVLNVSWEDAQGYCHWAGFSLPTEAQWEFAVRGPDSLKYFWGDYFELNPGGTFRTNIHILADGFPYTRSVWEGGLDAGPVGTTNPSGNVREWCLDVYSETSYRDQTPHPGTGLRTPSPTGTDVPRRVVRGASWFDSPGYLRGAVRSHLGQSERVRYVGFRPVLNVKR